MRNIYLLIILLLLSSCAGQQSPFANRDRFKEHQCYLNCEVIDRGNDATNYSQVYFPNITVKQSMTALIEYFEQYYGYVWSKNDSEGLIEICQNKPQSPDDWFVHAPGGTIQILVVPEKTGVRVHFGNYYKKIPTFGLNFGFYDPYLILYCEAAEYVQQKYGLKME